MSTTTSLSGDTDVASTNGENVDDAELEDLHKAVLVLKHLRKENQQLTRNFDNLKAIHLALVTSHRKLEGSYESLRQERVSVEQQYQQLCESWRAELDEKQRQFEQARAQILEPRDLDLLRVQLLEEVEAPYKAKCEAIVKEAEAAQKQFVQLRREHEALQNSVRSQDLQQQNELQLLQGQCDVQQQALTDKSRALEAAQDRAQQLEQQLRQAQQLREETALQLHFAKDEAAELRQAKEAAVVEREQLAVRLERRSQQQQAEISELSGLVESLTRKNRHLADELAESSRAQEAGHSQLMSLQASSASLASQLADAQALAARERQLLADKAAAAEQLWHERNKELLEQVLQTERQLAQLTVSGQQALRSAEAAAAEELGAAQQAAAARQREAAARIAELSSKLEAAEASAADLRAQLLEGQNKARLEVSAARCEAQELSAQLQDSQRQLGLLQQQLADATGQQEALRGSVQQLAAAAEPGLSAKVQSEARCALLEQQCQQLQQQLSDATAQLERLQQQQGQLQRECDKRLAAVKASAAAEREALSARNAAKVKKLQEAAKDQIRALRSKLKDSRAAAEVLTAELAGLKITLAEREAELAAINSCRVSMERPASAGSPVRFLYESPVRAQAAGVAALQSPVRTSLSAAFAGVRQRQKQYLEEAAAAAD
ncbi:hypothetical protein OEZ85_000716 [Tetradesmus obliquus]|uniref:Plectin n=1 Tax=Tetradesmus obliquus TaxID=3088 RepID=A0ABY8UPH2_TETOB|nr:hypothetical protein OEZ85_000716 [Tetradesmus obliquus]